MKRFIDRTKGHKTTNLIIGEHQYKRRIEKTEHHKPIKRFEVVKMDGELVDTILEVVTDYKQAKKIAIEYARYYCYDTGVIDATRPYLCVTYSVYDVY